MQCVWLWGVGQEIINYDNVIKNIKNSKYYIDLSNKEREYLHLRLKAPYPVDVTQST